MPEPAEVRRRVDETIGRTTDGRMQLIGQSGGDPVTLVETSGEWSVEFERLRRLLAEALGPTAMRIDHIGSTSVPGIAAKPVIDIQISVPDITDEAAVVPVIEFLGWPLRSREPELGHLYFRDPAGAPRRVQIHVCQVGTRWERKHLLFRDYLRTHPEAARAYERLKRAAVEEYGDDRWAYTEAKGPFIEAVLARAEKWAREVDWRVS